MTISAKDSFAIHNPPLLRQYSSSRSQMEDYVYASIIGASIKSLSRTVTPFRMASTPSLSASTDLQRWLTSALPRPTSLRRILPNCIFNMYSNITDCLTTLSQTAELNLPPVLQLNYYTSARYTVISLLPFTHNPTVKQNE